EHAPMSISYETDVDNEHDARAELTRLLERGRQRDLVTGTTGAGPHRDDLCIQLEGRDARTFASAAQQRTAAIALRLREARPLRRASSRPQSSRSGHESLDLRLRARPRRSRSARTVSSSWVFPRTRGWPN